MKAKYKKALNTFLNHCEENAIPIHLISQIGLLPAVVEQEDDFSAIIVEAVFKWHESNLQEVQARYVYKY